MPHYSSTALKPFHDELLPENGTAPSVEYAPARLEDTQRQCHRVFVLEDTTIND
jgi:hypothetical protein